MPYFCWFVESGPAGEHGYAMGNGILDSCCPPGGHRRFETLAQLREELYSFGVTNIYVTPRYIQAVPAGWILRPLTDEEARSLE